MSDLSLPPLAWAPPDTAGMKPLSPTGTGAVAAFEWPSPPYAAYTSGTPFDEQPQPCEVEGLNRKVISGRLAAIDPVQQVAQVLVPPSRNPMPLRFSQFRRLTLTTPLLPDFSPTAAGTEDVLDFRCEVEVRLQMAGETQPSQATTVGHIDHEAGVFLFAPAGDGGQVLRSFVPRSAIQSIEFGPRLGDVLVSQHTATPTQVRQALAEQQRLREQKIGDVLLTRNVVTVEQLTDALAQQSSMPMVRVGEALVAMGYVTAAQLQEALEHQKRDRSVPLGELLVRKGHITRSDLRTALARKMGYPVVDITAFPVERELLQRLPLAVAQRLHALPLMSHGGRIVVAMEDPSRGEVADEIEFLLQAKTVPVMAMSDQIGRDIAAVYAAGSDKPNDAYATPQDAGGGADALLAQLEHQHTHGDDNRDEPLIEQSDNSLVRLINAMIVEAHSKNASDIHIECPAGKGKVRIRFRRDGEMRPYMELPYTYRSAMLARLKIMCDLDISERRRPQDGKINFERFVPGLKLELRVATIPTNNGNEDAVMRLLASAKPIPLDKLNLSPANFQVLTQAIQRPYGMVLCVGPTGSGKTTTLHSALSRINTAERKIWTAEDPIEITQEGLRQVQVNPKIDWTFAKALRAFLRADPDVIMVGEIRDNETARIAVEASLTGHMVMSTLHTNSAPETVTRLLDMGLDPFNFADSLLAVLAQRLVRRLCPKCTHTKPASKEQIDEWLAEYLHGFSDPALRPSPDALLIDWKTRFAKNGGLQVHEAHGCDHCDHTGFRGRVGIHELLQVDREMRRLIQTGARAEELQRAAMTAGMRTLRQDGLEKVLAGLTSIEEVRATSNV
jgi:type II secretory ATPase GspE/PulE/Tfp pilus assembly ATPase PilB-like protein